MTRPRPLARSLAVLAGTLLVAWWMATFIGRAPAGSDRTADARNRATDEATTTATVVAAAPRPRADAEGPDAAAAAARVDASLPGALASGFRAPPAQRAADVERLRVATDLAPLLADFQRRAAVGDADAAARMRDIYAECRDTHTLLPPSVGPLESPTWGTFDRSIASEIDPSRAAGVVDAQLRCAAVLPGNDRQARTLALINAERESDRLASDLGHLVAQVRSVQGIWEPDPLLRAQRDAQIARALLREGTPEALMAISNYAQEGTRFSSDAWLLVACDQGYACAEAALIRRFRCARPGAACSSPDWRRWMRDQMPARAWRRAHAERDEILALLRAGDLEALMQRGAPAGGG